MKMFKRKMILFFPRNECCGGTLISLVHMSTRTLVLQLSEFSERKYLKAF